MEASAEEWVDAKDWLDAEDWVDDDSMMEGAEDPQQEAATKISLTPEQELVVAHVGAGKVYPVV
jgi:hypothetical protein